MSPGNASARSIARLNASSIQPPRYAAVRPERDADGGPYGVAGEGEEDRRPAAPEEAAEDIPADEVEAERMLRRWRREGARHNRIRRVGGQPGSGEGDADNEGGEAGTNPGPGGHAPRSGEVHPSASVFRRGVSRTVATSDKRFATT